MERVSFAALKRRFMDRPFLCEGLQRDKKFSYKLLILIAWFCGPAIIFALLVETWFFQKRQVFRWRRGSAIIGYLATIALVPAASIVLLAYGVGTSPLATQNSQFMVPWFRQSVVVACIIVALMVFWAARST